MWITLFFEKYTMESPSVWAGATCITWISSPFRWNVTSSANVTTGSAMCGAAGSFIFMNSMNWSVLMRL